MKVKICWEVDSVDTPRDLVASCSSSRSMCRRKNIGSTNHCVYVFHSIKTTHSNPHRNPLLLLVLQLPMSVTFPSQEDGGQVKLVLIPKEVTVSKTREKTTQTVLMEIIIY